jgi:uncharacterized protein YjbJ (UPF0337 family)
MNDDKVKGVLQKAGGRLEEAAGALIGCEKLQLAGQEDQIKGDAREAWGKLKDAGNALVDQARVANEEAHLKAARAEAFDREHAVVTEHEGSAEIGAEAQKQNEERQRREGAA